MPWQVHVERRMIFSPEEVYGHGWNINLNGNIFSTKVKLENLQINYKVSIN